VRGGVGSGKPVKYGQQLMEGELGTRAAGVGPSRGNGEDAYGHDHDHDLPRPSRDYGKRRGLSIRDSL
jgi:hypothetical protein